MPKLAGLHFQFFGSLLAILCLLLYPPRYSLSQSPERELVARWDQVAQTVPYQNFTLEFTQSTHASETNWQSQEFKVLRQDDWWSIMINSQVHSKKGEKRHLTEILCTDQLLIQYQEVESGKQSEITGYLERRINSSEDEYPSNFLPLTPWIDMLPVRTPTSWSKTMLESNRMESMQTSSADSTPIRRVRSFHNRFELCCDFEETNRAIPIRFEMRMFPGFVIGDKPLDQVHRWTFDEAVFEVSMPTFPRSWAATLIRGDKQLAKFKVTVSKCHLSAGHTNRDFKPRLPIKDGTIIQAEDIRHVACEWRDGRIQPVNPGKSSFADDALFMSPGWWGKFFLVFTVLLLLSTFVAVYLKNRNQ